VTLKPGLAVTQDMEMTLLERLHTTACISIKVQ